MENPFQPGDFSKRIRPYDEEVVAQLIEDAWALALDVAPCIGEDGFDREGAAKAILRNVILRWAEMGTGEATTQQASIYSQTIDTRQRRTRLLQPTDIADLQRLCGKGSGRKAFTISRMPAVVPVGSPLAGASINDPNAIGEWSDDRVIPDTF